MEITNWSLFIENDLDFKAGNIFNIDELPDIKTDTAELNQREFSDEYWNSLCTLYGILWSAYDNVWKLTKNDEYELCRIRYWMDDFDRNTGGWLYKWVDAVRNYYKSKWYKNITSITIPVWNYDFWKALDKWYRLNIWMHVKEWYLQAIDDWILNIDELWKNNKYWHSLSIKKIWDNFLIDNYKWILKYNIIKIEDFKKFISEWIIFKYAYLIYNPERDMEKEIRDNINLERAKKAFDEKIWNWLEWDKSATREEVAAMVYSMFEKLR